MPFKEKNHDETPTFKADNTSDAMIDPNNDTSRTSGPNIGLACENENVSQALQLGGNHSP